MVLISTGIHVGLDRGRFLLKLSDIASEVSHAIVDNDRKFQRLSKSNKFH